MKRRQRQNKTGKHHKEHVEQFLAQLVKSGTIRDAARAVGITHSNVYYWRDHVPGFIERLEAAQEQGKERILPRAKQTLYELGVLGVLETVRDKSGNIAWDPVDADGNDVPPGSEKKIAGYRKAKRRVYDVRALQLILKSLSPSEFGEHSTVKVSGADGGPVLTETTHKFDHAKFADLYRSRTRRAGDGAGDTAADRN